MRSLASLLSRGRDRTSAQPDQTTAATPGPADLSEYWPTDGWRHASPEALGFDPKLFASFAKEIRNERRIISACVVRHGYLAFEHFRDGADDLQMIYSITKSVVSLLVGIATGQGKLHGAEQPLTELFPELNSPRVDSRLQRLNIGHLLTMRSGVEPLNAVQNTYDTWGEYVAAQQPTAEPGTVHQYSAFDAHLLAVILQQVAGRDLLAYARENLFGPLGIKEVGWPMDETGVRIGSHGLMLRTLDMAKLGHLLLRRGQWDGAQIVPAAWVDESTRAHVVASDKYSRYGYLWWLHAKAKWRPDGSNADNFWALGAAGQYLYVAPHDDMVAVVTSYVPEDPAVPIELITRSLLPAVQR